MLNGQSKHSSPARWRLWYFAAALALLGAAAAAWFQGDQRPWQDEVAAINQRRGQRLERRLLAAGVPGPQAAARGRELATEPPRVIEISPTLSGRPERCLSCHRGIEPISPSHPVETFGCVICHGGNGLGLTKAQAHQGLRGRNPAELSTARASCGQGPGGAQCHAGRDIAAANTIDRVERGVMSTMTGVLTSLRVSWAAQGGFGATHGAISVSDSQGGQTPGTVSALRKVSATPPSSLGFSGLADEHWRKFCARCHLNAQRDSGPSVHGQGCTACHGMRDESGRYLGGDAAIADDEPGHAARHNLLPAPTEEHCRRCHNRSGRIGLNYQGWMEDESGRVPWPEGKPQAQFSGGRAVRCLLPDVHAEKGLACIDCHTPREIMGDGAIYGRMRFQTEIRCRSCHGAGGRAVRFAPQGRDEAYELRYGPLAKAGIQPGDPAAQSAKGRALNNLRLTAQGPVFYSRSQPGKSHPVAMIDTDPAHAIAGHQRLACQACHSRWTPQCYGCHDYYSTQGQMWDYAAEAPTPGTWRETRDIYRFQKPILGLDSRGRIRPFAPGCQAILTSDGQGPELSAQGPAGGTIVSTPVSPHTTRREVRPCADCHQSPRVLGLGGGPAPEAGGAPLALADLRNLGLSHDWDALADAGGKPLQAQTHQGARPLNKAEVARVLRFGKCLPCHYKPEDPVVRDPERAYARIAPGGDLRAKHQAQVEKALR